VAEDDQIEEDEDQGEPQGTDGSESPNLRQLREKAKQADELAKENAALKLERAFDKAKLPDSKTADYFRKTYTGDTSEDAIRNAAIEAGVIEDTGGASTEEIQGATAMQAAATGGTPPAPGNYEEELANAGTEAEALAVMRKHNVTVI